MSENGARQEQDSRLRRQIEQYCDGALLPEDAAEFEHRLRDDSGALQSFLLYLALHARLAWNVRSRLERGERNDECRMMNDEFPMPFAGANGSVHHSSFIIHHLPVMAFAYACAALMLALGIVAAGLWGPAGDWSRQAGKVAFAPIRADGEALIGTITATKDCRWGDAGAVAAIGSAVRLGHDIVLNSGRLEIAYCTGAIVTVEGPALFIPEAANSGFLLIGKISVSVAGGGAAPRPARGAPAVPESAASSAPVFLIRTPVAVLRTHSASFAVSVEKSGQNFAHVSSGKVGLQLAGWDTWEVLPLAAGNSALVAFDGSGSRRILYDGVGPLPASFSRDMSPEDMALKQRNKDMPVYSETKKKNKGRAGG